MDEFKESRARSAYKAIGFRLLAFLNSWIILSLCVGLKGWLAALIMNCTGFVILYFYERIWNKVKFGKQL